MTHSEFPATVPEHDDNVTAITRIIAVIMQRHLGLVCLRKKGKGQGTRHEGTFVAGAKIPSLIDVGSCICIQVRFASLLVAPFKSTFRRNKIHSGTSENQRVACEHSLASMTLCTISNLLGALRAGIILSCTFERQALFSISM